MDTELEHPRTHISKILLGFVLGIISIFVLLVVFALFNLNKTKQTPAAKTLKLELSSPSENLATSAKIVSISGTTNIKSIVSVTTGKQAKIVETSGSTFSISLDLSEGKNIITITAFDPTNGDSQQIVRQVLYLSSELTDL